MPQPIHVFTSVFSLWTCNRCQAIKWYTALSLSSLLLLDLCLPRTKFKQDFDSLQNMTPMAPVSTNSECPRKA
ncbi:hypothetical protein M438DRAFT_3789 [Aureobasidium pullulans EXF-150]|uniref:Uncharacterized protein n=1 Tax=Aureobasidium pullulans EXF-150 TaxID=1043002 RepID=A0A074XUU9_AURPU|nr:uncharacterized protein M438DRAFT_3789 [Aureobasidium pullulans EXF-150]KEQ89280.1 hypothetical protein M438DRAFT_3789 [Aureobasidium pullulans EXF-150]